MRLSTICFIAFTFLSPIFAENAYVLDQKELREYATKFTWDDMSDNVFRLVQKENNKIQDIEKWGFSAFFISSDGYFIAPYRGVKACLDGKMEKAGRSVDIPCGDEDSKVKFVAEYKNKEYYVSIVGHPAKTDIDENDMHKSMEWVIGKAKLEKGEKVGAISFDKIPASLNKPVGSYQLMSPHGRVFIPGFLPDGKYALATGEVTFVESNSLSMLIADFDGFGAFTKNFDGAPPAVVANLKAKLQNATGLKLPVQTVGAPVVSGDGKAKGLVVAVGQGQKMVFITGRKPIFDFYFTEKKPANATLEIEAGGTKYYLKSE